METIWKYLFVAMGVALFTVYHFSPDGKKSSLGLMVRILITLISTFAFAYLVYLFFGRHYEYAYVSESSNNSLSSFYRLSSVWQGQAGTFLLWYWLTALPLLAVRGVKEKHERAFNLGMSIVLIILGVLMARSSPFAFIHGADGKVVTPADGMGLNPLLINPWMAIHPPLMFVGYALVTVPFAFAIAGVMAKDYTGWLAPARWWALAAWAFLGTGIFLGSYWAYEVLGWGGYWGWDPVENASIFPWLMVGALLHGMLIQGGKKRFAFWNIVLALSSMVMIILTCYLTRSGALSEFSVHSFSKSDLYYPLTISLIFIIVYSAVVAGIAYMDISKANSEKGEAVEKVPAAPMTATVLALTIIALLAMLAFVIIGTFFPLVSPMFGGKAATLNTSYYNKNFFIVAVPLSALLLVCPFVFIKNVKGVPAAVRYIFCAVGAAVAVVLMLLSTQVNPVYYLLAPVAGAVVGAHLMNAVHFIKILRWNASAYLTHIGVGLMLVGILTSASGHKTKTLDILQGESRNWVGYDIKFSRIKPAPKEGADYVYLKLTGASGPSREVEIKFTAQTPDQRVPPKPAIVNSFRRDLYIAPREIVLENIQSGKNPRQDIEGSVKVVKDAKIKAGKYDLQMVKWKDTDGHEQTMRVTALVDVYDGDKKQQIELPFSPSMEDRDTKETVTLPDGTKLKVVRLDIDSVSAEIQVTAPGQTPSQTPVSIDQGGEVIPVLKIFIEVTEKPFIAILWWGMIFMCAGTFLALFIKRYGTPAAAAK